jgi:hypothetical protein
MDASAWGMEVTWVSATKTSPNLDGKKARLANANPAVEGGCRAGRWPGIFPISDALVSKPAVVVRRPGERRHERL